MIKKVKPHVKFIISGDYNQLKPVNDRISHRTDYSNAPCLFELADYNKFQLKPLKNFTRLSRLLPPRALKFPN